MASATSYELADRIAGDRIAVFKGRRADGVKVLMHQLTLGFDHSEVLKLGMAYMLHNSPADGGLLLDLVERDGLTYLVTADKPDCLELRGWLDKEVGHVFTRQAEVTAEVPQAAPQPAVAIEGASLVGFTPFLGTVQSTSGTLSTPQPTWLPARSGSAPLLTSSLSNHPPEPAAKAVESSPSQVPEPQAAPVTPAQSGPATSPDPSIASVPEAPAVYVIAQPKAGLLKTLMFVVLGFLVVAGLFWGASVVVSGMK